MSDDFWDHLLATASAIEELADADNTNLTDINAHMESIEVAYHRRFDPAETYAEYVAVTLCRALNKGLARASLQKTEAQSFKLHSE